MVKMYPDERRGEERREERRGEERGEESNLNPLGTHTGWWLVATFLSSESLHSLRADTPSSQNSIIFPDNDFKALTAASPHCL